MVSMMKKISRVRALLFALCFLTIVVTVKIRYYWRIKRFTSDLLHEKIAPFHAPKSQTFLQPVMTLEKDYQMIVVSAFRHPRLPLVILVLTIGHRQLFNRSIFCHLRNIDGVWISTTTSEKRALLPWKTDYIGHFLHCRLPHTHGRELRHVSLSFTANLTGNDELVKIRDIPANPPGNSTIAACVCPSFGSQINPSLVAAWIEWNRVLGIRHFTFYNYSMSSRLGPLFKYYSDRGIVTLIQWKTAPIPTAEKAAWPPLPHVLHYFGQVESNNDCLYRWANRYKYIMFTDLDELIISFTHNRLDDFLNSFSSTDKISAFYFQMSLVSPPLSEKTKFQPYKQDSVPLFERTATEDRAWNDFAKRKMIVNSNNVRIIAVHDVVDTWSSSRNHNVGENLARLYHYRDLPQNRSSYHHNKLLAHYIKIVTLRTQKVHQQIKELGVVASET